MSEDVTAAVLEAAASAAECRRDCAMAEKDARAAMEFRVTTRRALRRAEDRLGEAIDRWQDAHRRIRLEELAARMLPQEQAS